MEEGEYKDIMRHANRSAGEGTKRTGAAIRTRTPVHAFHRAYDK
jgi:hypothetical protein